MSGNEAKNKVLRILDTKSFAGLNEDLLGHVMNIFADLAEHFPVYFDCLKKIEGVENLESGGYARINTINPKMQRFEFTIMLNISALTQTLLGIATASVRVQDALKKVIYHEFAHMIDMLESNFSAGMFTSLNSASLSTLMSSSERYNTFLLNYMQRTFGKSVYSYVSDLRGNFSSYAYSAPVELFADVFALALSDVKSIPNNRFRCWLVAQEMNMWQFSEAFASLSETFMRGEEDEEDAEGLF